MSDPNAVSDPNPNNIEDANQTILLDDAPKPADTPKPAEPKPAEPAVGEVVEFEPTGDVGLDMALAFIGKQGISETHPAMVAATAGDFSILKATLAAKGTAGWEQFVALGEAAYARKAEGETKKAEAIRETVFKEAGGKEEWGNVQKWASSNATPEEKTQINALINQGGLAAKSAVKYLVDSYNRANNVEVNPRDPLEAATRGGVPNAATGPLSAKEYANAVQQLNAKLNGRLDGSPEYAKLQQRRAAFRG